MNFLKHFILSLALISSTYAGPRHITPPQMNHLYRAYPHYVHPGIGGYGGCYRGPINRFFYNFTPAYYTMWYCVAQSTVTGLWYYWYSPSVEVARYQALNACILQNGYTCVYACRWY